VTSVSWVLIAAVNVLLTTEIYEIAARSFTHIIRRTVFEADGMAFVILAVILAINLMPCLTAFLAAKNNSQGNSVGWGAATLIAGVLGVPFNGFMSIMLSME
jgi:hypothetical protein